MKRILFLLMAALLLSACGNDGQEESKEETKKVDQEVVEEVEKSDYEKIILDSEHPYFLSDNDSVLKFGEKHPKEKVAIDIVSGEKYSKYGDETLLTLKGFDSDGFIKNIEIYVGKTDEDLSIEEAINLADEYIDTELIQDNYFLDESIKIFSEDEDEDKSVYILNTYKKNEQSVEDVPHDFHVIVESNNDIADLVWINHKKPNWMNKLKFNGYESKEFVIE